MQDFLEKHWKKLVLGGLAGGAALLLLLLSDDQDKPAARPQKKLSPEEEKKSTLTNKSVTSDAAVAQKTGPVIADETKSVSRLRNYENRELKVPEFPEVSIADLAKQITVLFEEDGLSLDTIGNIFQYSLEVIKGDYVRLSLRNRQERRRLFYENKKAYTAMVIDFLEETENLLNKGSDELLEALNIPKELFENSCMIMMERGYFQQMMVLQAAIRQKIK